MLKIAITGNIACGKSLVLDYFAECGYKTLCLDIVTHKIYSNTDFKRLLVKYFNTSKRSEISKIVFENPEKLKILEDLIYPYILQVLKSFFEENKNNEIVFVAAPVLFEAGFEKYFDKIILVKANEDTRLQRVIKRDNCDISHAINKIKSQADEKSKVLKSDYIIDNNSDIEHLKGEFERVKREISTLL